MDNKVSLLIDTLQSEVEKHGDISPIEACAVAGLDADALATLQTNLEMSVRGPEGVHDALTRMFSLGFALGLVAGRADGRRETQAKLN